MPADKMHSYVSQNSYLIPVKVRFAGKTMTRDSKNSTVTPANAGHADRTLTTDSKNSKRASRGLSAIAELLV